MDCKAFQELGVLAATHRPSRSPNRDRVPMVVELRSARVSCGQPSFEARALPSAGENPRRG